MKNGSANSDYPRSLKRDFSGSDKPVFTDLWKRSATSNLKSNEYLIIKITLKSQIFGLTSRGGTTNESLLLYIFF